jgi:hypothetical protein
MRRTVTHAGIAYTIADDDPTPRALNQWAVVRTRAIDELTGEPPRRRIRVVTPLEHTPAAQATVLRKTTSRAIEGGICGLVARVSDVASALTRPGEFAARIEAAGYLPRDLTPEIDRARRMLTSGLLPGATSLPVALADPIAAPPAVRAQFRPGRGVLIERAATGLPDEFTGVSAVAPASAADVPIAPPLSSSRMAFTRVAGVPLHLPDQPMHRANAIRLRGRIQERLVGPPPSLTPALGARIGVLGYWRTYPSTVAGAPVPVDFVAVEPALYFDYPVGATVENCTATAVGPVRRLHAAAAAGSREIAVAPFTGLAAAGGDRLQLESGTSESEVVVTDGFDVPADPLGAAQVRLRTPTASMHRAQSAVQAVSFSIGIDAGPVTREAVAGDAVVFAVAVTLLAAGGFVALDHAGPRAAYHRVRRIPTATRLPVPPPPAPQNVFNVTDFVTVDADGYFEWPAIARVAQIEIAVMYTSPTAGTLDIGAVPFALDYEGQNRLSMLVR